MTAGWTCAECGMFVSAGTGHYHLKTVTTPPDGRTADYVRDMSCIANGRECCMHRSNKVLTMNPPIPVDQCCHCGREVYRYDLQHLNEPNRKGHGPYFQ